MIAGSKGENLWVEWAIKRHGRDEPDQIGRKAMVVKSKSTVEDYGIAGAINKPRFSR